MTLPHIVNYTKGNITDIDFGFIVHGVNCQGVMGSGVAKALKDKYPIVESEYKKYCDTYHIENPYLLGTVQYVKITPTLFVVNAFTQEFYGRDGMKYVSYDAIEKCFKIIVERQGLTKLFLPISFPKIGAGLGGGDWKIIEAILEKTLVNGGTCYEL